jgi:phthalate 4,5-dioxygenase oxygenase subunit
MKDLGMLSAEQNDLLTSTGPGTPTGKLMRCYWQPAALVDELSNRRNAAQGLELGEPVIRTQSSEMCILITDY